MLYRVQLREEAARALRAAGTLAGPNVWTARSLPIVAAGLPMIQLQILADIAESWGRAVRGFTRTAGLLVTARVSFKTAADGTSSQGEDLLDELAEQIENTLMTDPQIQGMVQQVSTIETEIAFDSTGADQIATLRIRFDLEYPQVFGIEGIPLTDIVGTITDELTGETLSTFDAKPCQPGSNDPAQVCSKPFGVTSPFP